MPGGFSGNSRCSIRGRVYFLVDCIHEGDGGVSAASAPWHTLGTVLVNNPQSTLLTPTNKWLTKSHKLSCLLL